ncbi:hypothetical protein DM794_14940 [Paenarthrobacter ureafaciens]|uniref:F510_1955 family glycosylhydrolase n=1 Tax=Paenarthrobacter ureafaciens TaxID=37931 RepID=UPI0015BC05AA|nr:exo-alpha-sialidase [Paenarthrobacter ureafaciens]MEC3852052.1 exo-alpha-sialidase [Paenarthrobacter ureafaciens]NWL28346.1 hypothetical protein [Paenarthrobacter ureafaciens]
MPLAKPSLYRAAGVAALLAFLPAMAACTQPSPSSGPAESSHGMTDNALPGNHVHALAVNSESGQVLLATHEGLFDVTVTPATKIGDTNDLMGFTVGAGNVFYASGHPGPGSSLPDPLGLMKSTDGGKTWAPLSRQGESDFHALTVTKSGIVGYDGQLRGSADGKAWEVAAAGFAPAVLAGHAGSDTVLATTENGIQRSTDGGKTWKAVPDGPVIQFAAFADPTEAFGVAPDGTTYHSADAGVTWTRKGRVATEVQAIAAGHGSGGSPSLWVATVDELMVSTDAGATFGPVNAN